MIIFCNKFGNRQCNCPSLVSSTQVKYLGIILDQHLRWDKQIEFLCKRLRKTIYKFVILRTFMPKQSLRIVFLALAQTLIQYSIISWGGVASSVINPLVLLHKRLIKICLSKKIDYPTKQTYSDFNVFTIDQIYKYSLLTFYHKNQGKYKSTRHEYSTRRQTSVFPLIEPKCNTSAALKHGASFGPRLYNTLTNKFPTLKNIKIERFKREILKIIHTL